VKRTQRDEDVTSSSVAFRAQLELAYGCWHRAEGTAHAPEAWFKILYDATAQEAATAQEMAALSAFAFVERIERCTEEAAAALKRPEADCVLVHCLQTLSEQALATPESANGYLRQVRHHFRDRYGMRGKLVMFPLRAALTGTMIGPCLGVVTSLLGCERCRQRLEVRLHDATSG